MSRSVPVNADTTGPARPQARDVAADALGRWSSRPIPRPPSRTPAWSTAAATSVLSALTSAGFLVVHQDALPPAVLAAVAGNQDSP